MMMLVHCCPTQGQLSPTWQSYAGLPPEEGAYVLYSGVVGEGRHGGGRLLDCASLEVMRGGGLRLKV